MSEVIIVDLCLVNMLIYRCVYFSNMQKTNFLASRGGKDSKTTQAKTTTATTSRGKKTAKG